LTEHNSNFESGTERTFWNFHDRLIEGRPAAWVAQMSDYRVYIIGSDGHFLKAIQLDCRDDSAAIESAKQFIDGHDIELWQRDRRIARFDSRHQRLAEGLVVGSVLI
jgi:hypothetical protein